MNVLHIIQSSLNVTSDMHHFNNQQYNLKPYFQLRMTVLFTDFLRLIVQTSRGLKKYFRKTLLQT